MSSSEIKSASNGPVARLPPELLVLVFFALSETIPITTKFSHRDFVPWLSVTHVCQKWRNVALACAPLWSRIPLGYGADMADEFIRRSKDVPLTLDEYFGDEFSQLQHVLQPNLLARTRKLHLPVNILQKRINCVLRSPAPLLETLIMKRKIYDVSSGTRCVDLPECLLNDDAPLLRTFVAHGLGNWPHCPLAFTGLRRFEMCYNAFQPSPRLAEIYHSLRSMPLLEYLRIDGIYLEDLTLSKKDSPFQLPHLRSLVLGGFMNMYIAILAFLRIPPHCRLCIKNGRIPHGDNNLHTTLSSLITHISATGFGVGFAPRALAITISDEEIFVGASKNPLHLDNCWRIRNEEFEGESAFSDTSADVPDAHLYICLPYKSGRHSSDPHLLAIDWVRTLLTELMCMHAVESACVSTHSFDAGDKTGALLLPIWTTALASCTRLSHLEVIGPIAYVLFRALADPELADGVLPSLQVLKFDEYKLSRAFMFEGVSGFDLLLAALGSRTVPVLKIAKDAELASEEKDALRAVTTLETCRPWWKTCNSGDDSEDE